jgi:hypothetical protein
MCSGQLRLPLVGLSPSKEEQLVQILTDYGLLKN